MRGPKDESPVLSIIVCRLGFAFLLFKGAENPHTWGIKVFRGNERHSRALDALEHLLDRHRPDTLVVEDPSDEVSRRGGRVRRLIHALVHMAGTKSIDVERYSAKAVRKMFLIVGARNKYEVAKSIARQFPILAHRLPRVRKAWMTEDPRQYLFDAAALGIKYFSEHIQSPYMDEI